jgi:hypothetical protein
VAGVLAQFLEWRRRPTRASSGGGGLRVSMASMIRWAFGQDEGMRRCARSMVRERKPE